MEQICAVIRSAQAPLPPPPRRPAHLSDSMQEAALYMLDDDDVQVSLARTYLVVVAPPYPPARGLCMGGRRKGKRGGVVWGLGRLKDENTWSKPALLIIVLHIYI